MELILHLSDLHLSRNPHTIGDYKSKLVPLAERINRQDVFESTMAAMGRYLASQGRHLDGVAVTGDITVADDLEGLARLSVLLDVLPDSVRPQRDHVVVVPGNHDVTWATGASTPERYAHFVDVIRSAGFSTPVLRGVDEIGGRRATVVGLNGDRVLLIPLNSSNYCGSLEPIGESTDVALGAIDDEDTRWHVEREFDRLRLHDVARIVPDDLRDLAIELDERVRIAVDRNGYPPVKLLCIHHHLLPVTVDEEVKSFETITNLGLLRNFISDHQIDIVLHGHKHAGFVYFDHIYSPDSQSPSPEHRAMVISGSTLGGVDFNRAEIARLVAVSVQRSAVTVGIRSIGAVAIGGRYREAAERRFHLFSNHHSQHRPASSPRVFSGVDVSEVYDQLLASAQGAPPDRIFYNVLCNVEKATWPLAIPRGYPATPSSAQGWFEALVEHWEKPEPKVERVPPSHGTRIRRFGVVSLDQMESAAKALEAKQKTSRAIITLVDPIHDDIADRGVKFPSFCSLQFAIRETSGQLYLDVYAYFRRQEFRYWWPVNVGEMSFLRSSMLKMLRDRGAYRSLLPGHLTTLAAIGHFGTQPPRVSVPLIDRLFESEEDKLWEMAYSLVGELDPLPRAQAEANWATALGELTPPEGQPDGGSPIAVEGLAYLADEVQRYARARQSTTLDEVVELLRSLLEVNLARRQTLLERSGDETSHQAWYERCRKYAARLTLLIRERLPLDDLIVKGVDGGTATGD